MWDEHTSSGEKPKYKVCNPHQILMENLLTILTILGVVFGVILGSQLRTVWTFEDYRNIFYLEFPGLIMMNMLKALILPLIVSSLVTAITSIGTRSSGKLGVTVMCYYMSTTMTAVIIGIVLVLVIHPGNPDDRDKITQERYSTVSFAMDSILDIISQCFPENLVSACFERLITTTVKVKSEPRLNTTDNTTYTVELEKPKLISQGGTNVMGVVVVSIALGCVINSIGEEGEVLNEFFKSLNVVTMILVRVVIWYTPIGIIFLVASKFISTKDIAGAVDGLAMYMVVILIGLYLHGLIVLPALYLVLTRKNPVKFGLNMMKAISTAWGTASSAATLPITMDCLIKKNHININVVKFVVPIGATINMDGTALYEAVACIFIAQVNGISLSVVDVVVISLTATVAAIGAAGIPQAGLVTMVIVLTAVGLPTEDITLILSIDWFVDRFRTVVNVWGDCVGAGILDHYFHPDFNKEAVFKDDTSTVDDGSSVQQDYDVNVQKKVREIGTNRRNTLRHDVETIRRNTLHLTTVESISL